MDHDHRTGVSIVVEERVGCGSGWFRLMSPRTEIVVTSQEGVVDAVFFSSFCTVTTSFWADRISTSSNGIRYRAIETMFCCCSAGVVTVIDVSPWIFPQQRSWTTQPPQRRALHPTRVLARTTVLTRRSVPIEWDWERRESGFRCTDCRLVVVVCCHCSISHHAILHTCM